MFIYRRIVLTCIEHILSITQPIWGNKIQRSCQYFECIQCASDNVLFVECQPINPRPHALLPRPNRKRFDWPRELVVPNPSKFMFWLTVGMLFFCRKGDLSPYKSFKIFWVILLLDSLNWLMCWHDFFCRFLGALYDLNNQSSWSTGRTAYFTAMYIWDFCCKSTTNYQLWSTVNVFMLHKVRTLRHIQAHPLDYTGFL